MRAIARILELSVATNTNGSGLQRQRRDEIRCITSPARRTAALMIDIFTAKEPVAATRTLDVMSRLLAGVGFVGLGVNYSVYQQGKSVVKVHRESASWTDEQRRQYIVAERESTDRLCSVMGAMAINQKYEIGIHPLGKHRVVLATQPFVPGTELPVFNSNLAYINEEVVADYCEAVSGGESALKKVVEATHDLYDINGSVPDTNGRGNLVVVGADRTLTIIDPQPIGKPHLQIVDLIRHQVDNLAEFLEAA